MSDPTNVNIILLCITAVIAISIVAAAIAFVLVGRAAFAATSPSAAGAFGLLFLALPALMTITLIIVATAVLTSYHYIDSNGCIAIFSSVASFVLGAESQKRKTAPDPAASRASVDGAS
jgi:hypothetical protein